MSYDDYTKANLHFDEYPFIDELGHTITVDQSPNVTNLESKFGGYSLNSGSNYGIKLNGSDFNLSAVDATIEFWMYPTASTMRVLFTWNVVWDGANWKYNELSYTQSTSTIQIIHNVGSSGAQPYQNISGIDMSLNAWHAIAIEITNGRYIIFVDGVLKANVSIVRTAFTSDYLWFGNSDNSSTSCMTGYMDEMRISKGIARYIADYTPLDVPFGTVEVVPEFPAAAVQYKINPEIWMKQSPLTVSENDEFYVSDEIVGGVEITSLDCHIYLGNTDKSYEIFDGSEQSYVDNRYTSNRIQGLKGGNTYVFSARVTIDGQIKTKKCEIRVSKESAYA